MAEKCAGWWPYVKQVSGTDRQDAIAATAGVDGSTVSRWANQQRPSADHAAKFARAFGDSPIRAMVIAGYLREEDFDTVVNLDIPLAQRHIDDLLEEIRSRIPDELAAARDGDADHFGKSYLGRLGDPGSGDGFKKRSKRA